MLPIRHGARKIFSTAAEPYIKQMIVYIEKKDRGVCCCKALLYL